MRRKSNQWEDGIYEQSGVRWRKTCRSGWTVIRPAELLLRPAAACRMTDAMMGIFGAV